MPVRQTRLPTLLPTLLLTLLALAACERPPVHAPAPVPGARPTAAAGSGLAGAAAGALVYVPAYSHVYAGDGRQALDLTTTLSIRNTDARDSLRVTAVHYIGSNGETLRSYLDAPRVLGPYATADFAVALTDRAGGVGASFLVEWTAAGPVSPPVVEAVMINTSGQQGISFVTEGRVVAEAGGQ